MGPVHNAMRPAAAVGVAGMGGFMHHPPNGA
jgi:hypothetical protein